MLYLITSASGLQNVYGQDGFRNVVQSLNTLAAGGGIAVRFLDDKQSMQGATPAQSQDPVGLRTAWQQIGVRLNLLQDYAVIVGDQRVFPSFSVANPVTDRSIDPDSNVLTDNPYGDFNTPQPSDCIQPQLAMGRIQAGTSDGAQDLCNILNWISLRSQGPTRTGYVEVTSRQWQDTSSFVLSALASSQRVFVSPDSRISASNAASLDCKYLYCNLHGFVNNPAWMGYDQGLAYPVPAITPDAFQSQYVSGTVVFTEACYGLAVDGKARSSSCALSLLAAGAGAVVGSAGLAFGTATATPQNLIDADVMARAFFNNALLTGQVRPTVGRCLAAARSALVQTASSADVFVKKTLLAFQILGDPSYALS